MSIISAYEPDKSNFLCKRFASLAVEYFEKPDAAKTPAARVPLENLFRVLEMYRNDTFSDKNRRGVLELGELQGIAFFNAGEDTWYREIKSALGNAMQSTFGEATPKDQAVKELQGAIRWLVKGDALPDQSSPGRAREFFGRLRDTLVE